MRPSLISVVAATCQIAAGVDSLPRLRAIGDTKIQSYRFEAVPTWSGNAVVAIERNRSLSPSVNVFDEDGREIGSIEVRIPGADYVEVRRAARSPDGLMAICGSAQDDQGRTAGFLALASAGGRIQKLVRTEPYSPTAVTFSPDGTIWMKGAEYVPVKRIPSKTNIGIIRHFDNSGKELAAYLPQSDLTWHELFFGIDRLASNAHRVGWYNGKGATTYYEVTDGRVERYPAVAPKNQLDDEEISGLAVTDSDQVFVTRSISGGNPELFFLDRTSRSWVSMPTPGVGPPETTSWLLGGSGRMLVFQTSMQSNWLRRFEVVKE